MLALPGSQPLSRDRSQRMTISRTNNILLSPGLKLDDTLRLGFQNFVGFPELSSHYKNDAYRSVITEFDFDIFGVSETNLVFHVAIDVSLSALFFLYLKAPCITLTPDFFTLRQHALDRTEELLMMPPPP
jgi:hypothetical protein